MGDVVTPAVADRVDRDLDLHIRIFLVEAFNGVLHRGELRIAAEGLQAKVGCGVVG